MVLPWRKRDDAVLVQLRRLGDSLTAPRPVVHFTYFPDRASADGFAADSRALGYVATITTDDSATRLPSHRFLVHLERLDSVDKPSFAPTLLRLVLLEQKHHGYYDGWECQVVSTRREVGVRVAAK